MTEISQAAIDLIVAEEVSSKATYIARYQHPEWPGGASGVTIGIGYDMGYSTAAQIAADWSAHVSPAMLGVMQSCAGITHGSAQSMLGRVRSAIVIPWEAAMDVFINRDVPKWTALCRSHLPHFDELSPDCKGALVSLAYNRGPAFDAAGDRTREMRAIKEHMIERDFAKIPDDFRSMKRLWPGVGGLQRRRDHEAALFSSGLGKPSVVPPQPAAPPSTAPAPAPDATPVPHPPTPPVAPEALRPTRVSIDPPPDRQATET